MRTEWSVVALAVLVAGFSTLVLGVDRLPGIGHPSILRFVGSIALVGCLAAGYVYLHEWSPDTAELPDVEAGVRVPVPGDSLDSLLHGAETATLARSSRQAHRDRAQDVLRTAVVSTLVMDADESVEDAERAVEEGSWTDDDAVAEFISGQRERRAASRRLPGLGGRSLPVDVLARRTVAEIERIREANR